MTRSQQSPPYSLYSEELLNNQIREIAAALSSLSYADAMQLVREQSGVEIEEIEYQDLTRVFQKYAKAGASLIGSW